MPISLRGVRSGGCQNLQMAVVQGRKKRGAGSAANEAICRWESRQNRSPASWTAPNFCRRTLASLRRPFICFDTQSTARRKKGEKRWPNRNKNPFPGNTTTVMPLARARASRQNGGKQLFNRLGTPSVEVYKKIEESHVTLKP